MHEAPSICLGKVFKEPHEKCFQSTEATAAEPFFSSLLTSANVNRNDFLLLPEVWLRLVQNDAALDLHGRG